MAKVTRTYAVTAAGEDEGVGEREMVGDALAPLENVGDGEGVGVGVGALSTHASATASQA